MYLFNKEGDKVEVYSIEPNAEKYKEYKKNEIEKKANGDLENCIYGIETDLKEDFLTPNANCNLFGVKKPLDVLTKDINFELKKTLKKGYHFIIPGYIPNNKDYDNFLDISLEKYIGNLGTNRQLVRVFDYNEDNHEMKIDEYLLFPSMPGIDTLYTTENGVLQRKKYISEIISLPKSLYLLELLRQGHYNLIEGDITEQISLFDISNNPVNTYSLEELLAMQTNGISKDAYDNTLKQVEESQKVLKYIK